MAKKSQTFSQGWSILAVLLVLLAGMLGQYKYRLIERTPLAQYLAPAQSSRDVSSARLAQILKGETPDERQDVDMSVFWQVWELLEKEYYEPEKLDPQKMIDGAVMGMTAALEDPYTAYLPPKDNERSGEDLAGSFYGVGIELGFSPEGILSVVAPLDGTPADEAGVQPNDLIIHVKDEQKQVDEATNGWSIEKAVEMIRGPKDSAVVLTLLRRTRADATVGAAAINGDTAQSPLPPSVLPTSTPQIISEPFEVTLKRGEIVVKSVTVEFVEHQGKRAAHVKLSRFGERTGAEWNAAVEEILRQRASISGIVLDMRNNPGGFFDSAIAIASDFIEDGPIVSQKGLYTNESYKAKGRARLSGIPTIVLVNGGSASASEIVAGALRDRLQIPLVGEKTFGKGTVQDRLELANGGGLHVTISQWLTPGGTWIHEQGIEAGIAAADNPETQDRDEALEVAVEQL